MDLRNGGKEMGRSDPLGELMAWLATAPAGTLVSAAGLAERLATVEGVSVAPRREIEHQTWRERLWTVPAGTRLGISEVAEAVGRSKSWVYRRTSPKSAKAPLPHGKLDGELVFEAGRIREWLETHGEQVA